MIYLLIAIVLIVIGHAMKSLRWKQLISTYEEIQASKLLRSMSIGQAINMIVPGRIGDVFRIWYIGKKELTNGYILSCSTVIIDILIDVVTVGAAFFALVILDIHRAEILNITFYYMAVSLGAIALGILAVILKKQVKLVISKVAGVFNSRLERRILMVSYTILSSAKDALKRKNIFRIMMYSVSVWICYFLSYACFASFLQFNGYDFTLTDVFKTIFSMAGDALLINCVQSREPEVLVWFMIYLLTPLIFLIALTARWQTNKQYSGKKNRIIPQINEREKIAFLNIYFEDKNRDYFESYLDINRDISVLRDCSAGSNATTILAMSGEQTFFRKYAFGEDAKTLYKQILWLQRYEKILPLCKIINQKYDDRICYYDMEYQNNCLGFFQYIHTSSDECNWIILNDVLNKLEDQLYNIQVSYVDKTVIQEYIQTKVIDNINICKKWGNQFYYQLFNSQTVIINGISYPNMGHYEKYFNQRYLSDVFMHNPQTVMHGDLTIENIICMQDDKNSWYLIDPNPQGVFESSFLDYAKLLQSLHGQYEFLMMVREVNVTNNQIEFFFAGSSAYHTLYEQYRSYLMHKFSYEEVKSIFYHEAIHWLRLMPYKIRKDPKSAIIFYAGMLIVLKNIEQMFE